MIAWIVQTLRSYPEIAIFLSLALGYYFGSFTYKGRGLLFLPRSRLSGCETGGLQRGFGCRTLRRLADDLGVDGPGD